MRGASPPGNGAHRPRHRLRQLCSGPAFFHSSLARHGSRPRSFSPDQTSQEPPRRGSRPRGASLGQPSWWPPPQAFLQQPQPRRCSVSSLVSGTRTRRSLVAAWSVPAWSVPAAPASCPQPVCPTCGRRCLSCQRSQQNCRQRRPQPCWAGHWCWRWRLCHGSRRPRRRCCRRHLIGRKPCAVCVGLFRRRRDWSPSLRHQDRQSSPLRRHRHLQHHLWHLGDWVSPHCCCHRPVEPRRPPGQIRAGAMAGAPPHPAVPPMAQWGSVISSLPETHTGRRRFCQAPERRRRRRHWR
mmetsp:Transcript_73204/g.203043  ORF Transcript_73204/g.203043 Transcript_73204/m.203043 type:complete len:295 (+) Transcript_73204:509-1393(+)